jgi:hypothetical protein
VDVATGEMTMVTDESYLGFALDRVKNVAYASRNGNEVYRINLDDNSREKIGELPAGGKLTTHFTAADTGRVACSYHLPNKIYSLIILDPGKPCEIVYQSDYRLGHAQICPTDENLIFYIHETEGDAFQRTILNFFGDSCKGLEERVYKLVQTGDEKNGRIGYRIEKVM